MPALPTQPEAAAPDVRMSPEALALRLMTGREHMNLDLAERLLAEVRTSASGQEADAPAETAGTGPAPMRRQDVPHDLVMAGMQADSMLHFDAIRSVLAVVLPMRDAAVRSAALNEAAAAIDNDDECGCGGCDTCQPRKLADLIRRLAAAPTTTTPEEH